MSKELDRAAAAWDRAEREGRLKPPSPGPDTRPRDALTNRVITFTPKVSIGGDKLLNNHSNPFER
jgi:hypothetical protein